MASLGFLQQAQPGNATLRIHVPNETVTVIPGLNTEVIAQRCPLLALGFESGSSGPTCDIEADSYVVAVSFLRYIFCGSYVVYGTFDHQPRSLLVHAELFRIAGLYDVPDLQMMARANIIADTEWSCSVRKPPDDLCAAIRFIYTNLSKERNILDTILQYCLSCFIYHGLKTNDEFRNLTFELHAFQRDLCQTNFQRNFEDDGMCHDELVSSFVYATGFGRDRVLLRHLIGAVDIISLPVSDKLKSMYSPAEKVAVADFLQQLWIAEKAAPIVAVGPSYSQSPEPQYNLVLRPRMFSASSEDTWVDASLSDVGGAPLAHRPKNSSTESYASSDDWTEVEDWETVSVTESFGEPDISPDTDFPVM